MHAALSKCVGLDFLVSELYTVTRCLTVTLEVLEVQR